MRVPAPRSEAVTLLSALQREARFVDIVKEPLDQYTDAQVGAAARDVLKDCGRVLERLFALRPLVEQPEGSELEAPAGYDAGRYRLVGKVQGEPPFGAGSCIPAGALRAVSCRSGPARSRPPRSLRRWSWK